MWISPTGLVRLVWGVARRRMEGIAPDISPPWRRRRAKPLIVAYHAISETWLSPLAVSLQGFERQMEFFASRGYRGVTVAESDRLRSGTPASGRILAVTFDDAFRSVMLAAPVLERLGWPATVFVVTSFVDSGQPLNWYGLDPLHRDTPSDELEGLDWGVLRRLHDSGWEVGSHTVSHPLLTRLSTTELERELEDSRRLISKEIGECLSIAYPYGVADRRVAEISRGVGYRLGVTLTGAHIADSEMLRPRLGLNQRDMGSRLLLKTSRVGLAARKSWFARSVRWARRGRSWLPGEGMGSS
jgi:peptidoglycan/xylan/chitin deacetylase (PgdA/CDA1 family)